MFCKRTPQFQRLPDIPVKTTMDRADPSLNNIALLTSDWLVYADRCNQLVKLVDVVQDKVQHELKVDGVPAGVCSLPGNMAAVALLDKQIINIMNCDNQLSIVNRITGRGSLRGLAYSDGHLIVLNSFGKIEILHMNGGVFRQHFLDIFLGYIHNHLSIMTEGNVTSIFVVDSAKRRIHHLDENLQVQQVYSLPGRAEPISILAVGENQVLVSDLFDRLWQLDTTMGRWTKRERFLGTYVMAFCHDRHILYCSVNDAVNRYAIS